MPSIYNSVSSSTTPNGMNRFVTRNAYGTLNTEVFSTFTNEHPMYKKYGITNMHTTIHNFGDAIYIIEGDVFGKRFLYKALSDSKSWDCATAVSASTKMRNFLNILEKAQKCELTETMKSVIIPVAKYLK